MLAVIGGAMLCVRRVFKFHERLCWWKFGRPPLLAPDKEGGVVSPEAELKPELVPPGGDDDVVVGGDDDPVVALVGDDEDEPSKPFLDRSDGRKASWNMGA
jgi:hypothetical protein